MNASRGSSNGIPWMAPSVSEEVFEKWSIGNNLPRGPFNRVLSEDPVARRKELISQRAASRKSYEGPGLVDATEAANTSQISSSSRGRRKKRADDGRPTGPHLPPGSTKELINLSQSLDSLNDAIHNISNSQEKFTNPNDKMGTPGNSGTKCITRKGILIEEMFDDGERVFKWSPASKNRDAAQDAVSDGSARGGAHQGGSSHDATLPARDLASARSNPPPHSPPNSGSSPDLNPGPSPKDNVYRRALSDASSNEDFSTRVQASPYPRQASESPVRPPPPRIRRPDLRSGVEKSNGDSYGPSSSSHSAPSTSQHVQNDQIPSGVPPTSPASTKKESARKQKKDSSGKKRRKRRKASDSESNSPQKSETQPGARETGSSRRQPSSERPGSSNTAARALMMLWRWRFNSYKEQQERKESEHRYALEIVQKYMRESRAKLDKANLQLSFQTWRRNVENANIEKRESDRFATFVQETAAEIKAKCLEDYMYREIVMQQNCVKKISNFVSKAIAGKEFSLVQRVFYGWNLQRVVNRRPAAEPPSGSALVPSNPNAVSNSDKKTQSSATDYTENQNISNNVNFKRLAVHSKDAREMPMRTPNKKGATPKAARKIHPSIAKKRLEEKKNVKKSATDEQPDLHSLTDDKKYFQAQCSPTESFPAPLHNEEVDLIGGITYEAYGADISSSVSNSSSRVQSSFMPSRRVSDAQNTGHLSEVQETRMLQNKESTSGSFDPYEDVEEKDPTTETPLQQFDSERMLQLELDKTRDELLNKMREHDDLRKELQERKGKEEEIDQLNEECRKLKELWLDADTLLAQEKQLNDELKTKCVMLEEGRKHDKEKLKRNELVDKDRKRQIEKLKGDCMRDSELAEEKRKLAEEYETLARKKQQQNARQKTLDEMKEKLDRSIDAFEREKQEYSDLKLMVQKRRERLERWGRSDNPGMTRDSSAKDESHSRLSSAKDDRVNSRDLDRANSKDSSGSERVQWWKPERYGTLASGDSVVKIGSDSAKDCAKDSIASEAAKMVSGATFKGAGSLSNTGTASFRNPGNLSLTIDFKPEVELVQPYSSFFSPSNSPLSRRLRARVENGTLIALKNMRLRRLLVHMHEWHITAINAKHRRHQKELKDEFDKVSETREKEMNSRLDQERQKYEKRLVDDKIQMEKEMGEVCDKIQKVSRLEDRVCGLTSETLSVRAAVTLFGKVLEQKMTIFEGSITAKIKDKFDQITRMQRNLIALKEKLQIDSKERLEKLDLDQSISIGDMYRDLKITYGKLLTAHGAKKRELMLAQSEIKRLSKSKTTGKPNTAPSRTLAHSQSNTILSGGVLNVTNRTPNRTPNRTRPSETNHHRDDGPHSHFASVESNSARVASLEQQVATLQTLRGKSLEENTLLEERCLNLDLQIVEQRQILQKQNKALRKVHNQYVQFEVLRNWRNATSSLRDVDYVSAIVTNKENAIRDGDVGDTAELAGTPSEDDIQNKTEAQNDTTVKEVVAKIGENENDSPKFSTRFKTIDAEIEKKRRDILQWSQSFNKEPSLGMSQSTGLHSELSSQNDARSSANDYTRLSASANDATVSLVSIKENDSRDSIAVLSKKRYIVAARVPPFFLRSLKRSTYENDLEKVRFCYYVWIFSIREKRYESALLDCQKQHLGYEENVVLTLQQTEKELQKALLGRAETDDKWHESEKKIEKMLMAAKKDRLALANAQLRAESAEEEIVILRQKLQSQEAESPKILTMEAF